jgi:hypothetical protein
VRRSLAKRTFTHVPVLSANLPVDVSGRYDDVPHIVAFGDRIQFLGGVNAPKLVTVSDSHGHTHRELVGWVWPRGAGSHVARSQGAGGFAHGARMGLLSAPHPVHRVHSMCTAAALGGRRLGDSAPAARPGPLPSLILPAHPPAHPSSLTHATPKP